MVQCNATPLRCKDERFISPSIRCTPSVACQKLRNHVEALGFRSPRKRGKGETERESIYLRKLERGLSTNQVSTRLHARQTKSALRLLYPTGYLYLFMGVTERRPLISQEPEAWSHHAAVSQDGIQYNAAIDRPY